MRAPAHRLRERCSPPSSGEGGQAEVARALRVGERSLVGWLQVGAEGRREPKGVRHAAGRWSGGEVRCWRVVGEQNDATLAE
jgi:hypothetical protein